MLLEFGARNFYSFKEGFEVSMRLGDSCPDKISKGKSYANVLAVKGANASGKTNVLKLLSFIKSFVTDSFNSKPEDEIGFNSYFYNKQSTDIYIVFLNNSIEYRYELELNKIEIISEKLYRKDRRYVKIFERKNNKLLERIEKYSELDIVKLRNNASIISTAHQYDIEILETIYSFFRLIVTNVTSMGRTSTNSLDYLLVSKYYYHNKNIFQFVQEKLLDSDIGINQVKIFEDKNTETGKLEYFPYFNYNIEGKEKTLTFSDQSSGTQALYRYLGAYKIVLDKGGLLVLDEFDINLHPDLLPMLIDFFDNEEKNPNNAQLIFTTHHTDIMDKLGKYRVVLVNKEDNESYLYRLDEIQGDMLRNDRSIVQKYKEGKIGGKPRLAI